MMPLATIDKKSSPRQVRGPHKFTYCLAAVTAGLIVTAIAGFAQHYDAARENSRRPNVVRRISTPGPGRVVPGPVVGSLEYHTHDGHEFVFDRANLAWVPKTT